MKDALPFFILRVANIAGHCSIFFGGKVLDWSKSNQGREKNMHRKYKCTEALVPHTKGTASLGNIRKVEKAVICLTHSLDVN